MSLSVEREKIAGRAHELAVELVQRFGPRPAGSSAETEARSWIAQKLSQWGYHTQFQSVLFPPYPQMAFTIPLAGVLLAMGAWLVAPFPFLPLLAPLGFYFLPYLLRLEIKGRKCTEHSENLIAVPVCPESARRMLLVAHLDSAPARNMSGIALRLYSRSLDVGQRTAFAIAAGGALQLLGIHLPVGVLIFFGILGTLSGGWLTVGELWNQMKRTKKFSPGGNDNASGVGVVLALAEYFSTRPGSNVCLNVLITTAEETGLHGARTFAKTMETS